MNEKQYHILNAIGWILIASLAYSGIYVPGKDAIFWGGFILAAKSIVESRI